ncbi:MAG: hypothetical protein ORN25_07145, partial [Caulobacteraceae bacterium]|nr:hypothetical protein [Caulobacteraceae bacterium]
MGQLIDRDLSQHQWHKTLKGGPSEPRSEYLRYLFSKICPDRSWMRLWQGGGIVRVRPQIEPGLQDARDIMTTEKRTFTDEEA